MANSEGTTYLKNPKLAVITPKKNLPKNPAPNEPNPAPNELANSLVCVRKLFPKDFLSRDITLDEIYANMVGLFDLRGEMPGMNESNVQKMIAASWHNPNFLEMQAKELRKKYGELSQEVANTLRLISQKASDAVKGYEDAIRAFPAKDSLNLGAAKKAYLEASEKYWNALAIGNPNSEDYKSKMEAAKEQLGNVRRTLDAFDRIHDLANIATYSYALAKEIAPEDEGRSAARKICLSSTYVERALRTGLPVNDSNP